MKAYDPIRALRYREEMLVTKNVFRYRILFVQIMLITASYLFVIARSACAETVRSLENEGWSIVFRGTVSETFNGCDLDLPVPIDEGYLFLCREYNYHYAYRPEFCCT